MNSMSRLLVGALLPLTPAFFTPVLHAGAEESASHSSSASVERDGVRKEIRSEKSIAPRAENRSEMRIRRLDRPPMEMETVAFLGVETMPVSPTLIAQLNIPDRAGLVVTHVVPESGAAGVLQPHDILLRLDDQILIDQHQLAVLIRNRKEGDEVNLTYLRSGKQANARVKLGRHEVPKSSDVLRPAPRAFTIPGAPRREIISGLNAAGREEVDHLLSVIGQAPGPGEKRVRIEANAGRPGMRATSVFAGNSNLVFTDDAGSLELVTKDGTKTLVAKNATGEQQFSGPVTTPEERAAMPPDVRERLEKLEAMQNVTFRTDSNFERMETRVLAPAADPI